MATVGVKTHEQASTGPGASTQALTRRLADLAKADGSRFSAVVGRAHALVAAGVERDQAYAAALDETTCQ